MIKKITKLTEKELERFSRQIIIEKVGYEGQLALMNTSVLIIGCGGLGSSAIMNLAMSGIKNIGVIDYDEVDISNLNRQALFAEDNVGQSKIEVAKNKILSINSKINLNLFNEKMNKKNAKKIIKNYQYILDCTDNFTSRYLINEVCFKEKKTLISAALYNFEIQLFIFKAWSSKSNPCYNCIFPKIKNSSKIQNCDDLGIIGPVANMGGLLQAMSVLRQVLKIEKNSYKEFLLFDMQNFSQKKIIVSKNTDCSICKY